MKTKNIRFLLISMLTIIFITSCSSPTSTPESTPDRAAVQLKITAGHKLLFENNIPMSKDKSTVIDILKAANEAFDAKITISDDGKYMTKTDNFTDTEKDGFLYTWDFTVNGEKSAQTADIATVSDGDVIEYRLTWGNGKIDLKEGAKYTAEPVEWFRFNSVNEKNRIVQGGCFTGNSFIIAFLENDEADSRIILAEIGTDGNIIRTSEPLDLAHANNIAYNVHRGRLIVSHCQQNVRKDEPDRYSTYSFVDPRTFEITETDELKRPFFSIGYSFERGLFGAGEWAGGTVDVYADYYYSGQSILLLKNINVEIPKTLSQGVWCDDTGIWFVRSSQDGYPCEIRIYDWENCKLKFEIPINNMDIEPESINIYGDEVYIVCNNKEYNGGIVYKLNFNETE